MESLSVSKGPKTFLLHRFETWRICDKRRRLIYCVDLNGKITIFNKAPPAHNFSDCLPVFWESEEDGEAWEAWDEDEAEVPAITLLSSNFGVCICCFVETVL